MKYYVVTFTHTRIFGWMSLAPTGMTFYPGETLRFMVSSQNITGNVHPGVPAYVSKDNHGKHIIHCGGDYKSYLQIGILK